MDEFAVKLEELDVSIAKKSWSSNSNALKKSSAVISSSIGECSRFISGTLFKELNISSKAWVSSELVLLSTLSRALFITGLRLSKGVLCSAT